MNCPSDAPATPWDIEVDATRKNGLPLAKARDLVIADWLRCGDTRPLAALLLQGHCPGPGLLRRLGETLLGDDIAKNLPPDMETRNPYQLTLKPRSPMAGRRADRANKTRDALISYNVHNLMRTHGLTYEAAVARIEEVANETGAGISEKTIRNAYDARHGKKSGI